MTAITKATVNDYWHKKNDAGMMATLMMFLFVVGIFLTVLGCWTRTDNVVAAGLGSLALGGVGASVAFAEVDEVEKKGPETPEEQLLERWLQFSGLNIRDFPTTDWERKLLAVWAESRLRTLATKLNESYDVQKNLYRTLDEAAKNLLRPKGVGVKFLKKIHEIDLRVRDDKEAYLSFWDLVAEGKEESVGILKGPDWQDPEVFRQKILKEESCPGSVSH